MTTNDTLEKTQVSTPEVTKAELVVALSKEGLAYQQLLQDSENVVFTKDNINEERSALINLRKVKKKLEDFENPWTSKWKSWNDARRSLVEPVAALMTKKEQEFRAVSREIEEENRKAEAEKQRKAAILSEIDNFFINQSQIVAVATSPEDLVRIEKLLGSHRAASRYQEYLPLMTEKAQILAEMIKRQKDAIKKIADLRAKEAVAEAKGDDQAVLDLREAQETVTATIEQGKIDVQEKSISMATNSEVTEVEVIAPAAPKARRSVWKWEVQNIKACANKMPEWVRMEVNADKVDEYLKAKKVEGIDGEEFLFAGIRFYLEKTY